MDPQYQQPAPYQQPGLQPPNTNPYDFIFNPAPPPKKKAGGNLPVMLGLVVGGAIILVVVIAIVMSLLNSGKGSTTEDMVGLVQSQNEIVRVSTEGVSSAIQQTTKNLAVTAEYAVLTQQGNTTVYLAEHGRKLGTKEVALKQNARTDQQFTTAKSTSTFDLVYSQTMQSLLTDYASELKQVFTKTQNSDTKALLSNYYEQTQLLISQIPYTQDSINGTTTQ
jgi:hypothetical protein